MVCRRRIDDEVVAGKRAVDVEQAGTDAEPDVSLPLDSSSDSHATTKRPSASAVTDGEY